MVDDKRVGDYLGKGLLNGTKPKFVLVGFCVDEGVTRNGGRKGAAQAPDIVRSALNRLYPDADNEQAFIELLSKTKDLGNIVQNGTLKETQTKLGETLEPYLKEGVIPIVIGGGHETGFGHFLGYVKAGINCEIINWDAHADVRELKNGLPHSGSPFREALEHPSRHCKKYAVCGLLPYAVSVKHLNYIKQKKGAVHFKDEITKEKINKIFGSTNYALMNTFDLDAIDASMAPGVSAPSINGMKLDMWFAAAEAAGRCPNSTSIDVAEMNPLYDQDGQTAKIAALTIWHFLKGFVLRKTK